MSQNPPLARHVVTAVIVAHDGARWLADSLKAVLTQARPVDRLVAADTGSRDHGPALLDDVVGADSTVTMPRSTGYGAAVAAALKLPAASAPVPATDSHPYGEDTVEWIWLLHDDCAPDPHACEQLLRTAEREPRAKIIGPKVRDWHDRRVLLEAGVTIDGAGRRETGLEPYEFDQGQRDGDRTVLAVGSAGMLVRRDVWDTLGGFDPALKLFRDDIDFCWRAGSAGHKVLITTTAVVYHAEASARRRRPIAAGRGHPRRLDRRNALYVLFANLPAGALLVAMVRALFGSLLRTLLLLLAKQPGSALDELAAIGHVYGRPLRMLVARRRRARNRRRGYSAIRPYMARGLAAARLAAMIGGLFGGAATPVGAAGRHHAGAVDEDGEEDLLADTRGPVWRVLTHPGVLLVAALTLVTLAAERSLLVPALTGKSAGLLGGGALVPVTGGASDLWRQYLAGWHAVGLGSADAAPPATAVVAAVATVLFGSVPAAVGLLLLGCVPLAGLAVYVTTRHTVTHPLARVWLAASYALLPVATGAVAAGRLGTAVAIVVLPVLGVFLAKMLVRHGARARRAAWSAALLLAVVMAFVPLVWPLILVIGGLIAVAFGGRKDQWRLLVNVAIVVVTPPLLLGPWAWALFAHPSRFLLETGLARPGLADPALPARSLLLLSPGGPGVPPVWVTAGFLLAALVALCLRRHRVLVAAGWGVALLGLLVAILVSRVAPTGGSGVVAWPGVALGVAATGLLLAAATATGAVLGLVRGGGLRRVAGVTIVALACSSPVLTAVVWMVRGADVPLTRTARDPMPSAVAALSGNRTGTLVVRPERGTVAYTVLRGTAPRFADDGLRPPDAARRRLDALVSGLMSGRGGDDGNALAGYGIRFVLLPAPVDAAALHRLDGVPGMSRMTLTSDYAVWRVTRPTARLRVVAPSGAVTAVPDDPAGESGARLAAGPSGRRLELAEPADGGWSATLNGRALRPVTVNGWSQAFTLPPDGGTLNLTRDTFWHDAFLWAQAIAFLAALSLSLPGRPAQEATTPAPGTRHTRGHRHALPAAPTDPSPVPTAPEAAPEPASAQPVGSDVTSTGSGAAPAGSDTESVVAGAAEPGALAEHGQGTRPVSGAPGLSEHGHGEAPAPGANAGPGATGGIPAVDAGAPLRWGEEPRPSTQDGAGSGEAGPGRGARGRPEPADPLVGTPLSRATPISTAEVPTPLATGPLPVQPARREPLRATPPEGPRRGDPSGAEPARDEGSAGGGSGVESGSGPFTGHGPSGGRLGESHDAVGERSGAGAPPSEAAAYGASRGDTAPADAATPSEPGDGPGDGWSWFTPAHPWESTRDAPRTPSVADEMVAEDDVEPAKDAHHQRDLAATERHTPPPTSYEPAAGEPPAAAEPHGSTLTNEPTSTASTPSAHSAVDRGAGPRPGDAAVAEPPVPGAANPDAPVAVSTPNERLADDHGASTDTAEPHAGEPPRTQPSAVESPGMESPGMESSDGEARAGEPSASAVPGERAGGGRGVDGAADVRRPS